MKRWLGWALLAVTALLASCGGGGGCGVALGAAACNSDNAGTGNTQAQVVNEPAPAVTSPVPSSFTVQGTAAEGLAIGNAPVSMVCVRGAGQAVTDSRGGFSLSVTDAIAPCLLEVVSSGSGQRYHGMLLSGSRANITPVTELITAASLGVQPVQVFSESTLTRATKLAALSESSVAAAATKVVTMTQVIAGAQLSATVDYLKGTFVAATSVLAGDATDQKLDALVAAVEFSGQSIFSLSQTVITATEASVAQGVQSLLGAATNSLPGCPSARSGEYWMLTSTGYGFYFPQTQGAQALSMTLDGLNRRAYRRYWDGEVKVEALDFIQRYRDGVLQPCLFDVSNGQGGLMEMRVTADGIGLLNTRLNTVAVLLPRQTQTTVATLSAKTFRNMSFRQVDGLDSDYNYQTQLSQWVFGSDGQSLANYTCALNGVAVQCASSSDKTMSAQLRNDGAFEFRDPDGTPTVGVVWRYRDQTMLWLSMRNGTSVEPVGWGVGMSGGASCTPPTPGVKHEMHSYSVAHAGSTRTLAASTGWMQTTSYNANTGVAQMAVLPTGTSQVPSDYYFDNWRAMGDCTSYRGAGVLSSVQPRMMMNMGRDLQVGMSTDYSPQRGATMWLTQRSIKE